MGLLSGGYGAVVTFFYAISDPSGYTVVEVSTLSALILMAHALPIESKISKLLGVGFFKTIFFRLFSTILIIRISFFIHIYAKASKLLSEVVGALYYLLK
ncbi:hypothetical protein BGC33_11460 [Bathymodiolus thermophilus thioautotrophic gill symbiont]|uniref:Uncharacterized protein n=1 Tax=Bathymodiolus thermophilus thioautotrophic gill symbiont TaxID=2360 RepID=A0A1J5TV56_9GAMM|nr:hypothetical protein BGC33_11460 [Bathymodiolus thermophilus thioautotrophic gill symbiont]